MRHQTTVLHDLLKLLPWGRFEALVDSYETDHSIRTLSTKSQLIALLHAQLSGAVSLREIVATMASHQSRLYHLGAAAPKRSTLADANAKRRRDCSPSCSMPCSPRRTAACARPRRMPSA